MNRRRRLINPVIDNINIDEYIDRVYYINLEERVDRKKEILEELKILNIDDKKIKRIDAVKNDIGIIGCTMSHIKALEDAIENNYNNVIIFEDDFNFYKHVNVNEDIKYLFDNFSDYDICLLAGNVIKKKIIDKKISWCQDVQTASGYIINKNFMNKLLDNFKEAYEKLVKGEKKEIYANDINWKKLQPVNNFFIFTRRLGYQRPSYSNIEKRFVNYKV